MPLYQCSGYSRLTCKGCCCEGNHTANDGCNETAFCPIAHEKVHCEPVEEEGDE